MFTSIIIKIMIILKQQETAIISIDNTQTFQNKELNELYVQDGEKVAKESKKLLNWGTDNKILKINVKEKHPYGHISFASSYKYKRKFETITYEETKEWEETMLSKTAWFNIKQLKNYLKKQNKKILRPDHSVNRTQWIKLTPPLKKTDFDIEIIKGNKSNKEAYSWFDGTTLHKKLQEKSIKNIIICWVATDFCVWETAMDAKKLWYNVFIEKNAIAWVDIKTTKKKIIELKKNKIKFINTKDEIKIDNNINILTINAWSSSLKFQIINMPNEIILLEGKIEDIWEKESILQYSSKWKKEKKEKIKCKNHDKAISKLIEIYKKENLTGIDIIGHRIVHWWEMYKKTSKINKELIKTIDQNTPFAPLHTPANKAGILATQKYFPKAKQFASFDTAFHSTIPQENYLLPIEKKYYQKYKIRKYWFHGISHKYISKYIKNIKNIKTEKVISCHIWNGASLCAIRNWKSIANSMWLSTLSWTIMWTRPWDIDNGVITYLMKKEKLSPKEMEKILYSKSWILWISWISNNLKIIVDKANTGNKDCSLAIEMYCSSIAEHIATYIIKLNWVDTIIFTGGVLEKEAPQSAYLRWIICKKISTLWAKISKIKNYSKINWHKTISTQQSKIKIIIIPTNEELMIARDCYKLS